jgi:hypothetical protein
MPVPQEFNFLCGVGILPARCLFHKNSIFFVGWASCPRKMPVPQEFNFLCGVGILPAHEKPML